LAVPFERLPPVSPQQIGENKALEVPRVVILEVNQVDSG
jgi:hypothetical protein